MIEQYGIHLKELFQGNMGSSFVSQRCPKEDPVELLDAGENGHRAACWLPAP